MALLFIDGFDHYQPADVFKKWDSGSAYISNTGGRRGGGAYNGYSVQKNLQATVTSLFMGAAAYLTSLTDGHGLLSCGQGNIILLDAVAMSDGSLAVYNGNTTILGRSAPGVIALNKWFYVEAHFVVGTPTTGAVEIRVNGVTVLSLTGINGGFNGNTSYTYYSSVRIGDTSTAAHYFDDFYLLDTTGTTNNTFLGDCRVDAYYPSSEGTTVTTPVAGVEQWTPTPSGSHWPCVSTKYPVATPTTYVTDGAVIGNTDEYGITDMANNPIAVFGVQLCTLASTSDAGAASIANGLVIETGASPGRYYGGNISVSNSQAYAITMWSQNPSTSAAWTKADVNAALASVKRAA